jgi:hypothetical protein
VPPRVNAFFQRFYQTSAGSVAALEAREHTAQVLEPGERERRERRFRWEESDRQKEADLARRLPYLVCSPTMELGVDIADLDLVHPAKCAANARKLRPAERPRWAAGAARADRYVLRGDQRSGWQNPGVLRAAPNAGSLRG